MPLDLLERDHQRIKGLFELFNARPDLRKHQIVYAQIRFELEMHAFIEESALYPTLELVPELSDKLSRFEREHEELHGMLEEVQTSRNAEQREARMKAVIEFAEKHLASEEAELFPKILEALSRAELEQLARQVEALKRRQSAA